MSVVKRGARTTPGVDISVRDVYQRYASEIYRERDGLTKERVQNLHGSRSLRPLGEFADIQVHRLWARFNERRDGALEHETPGQGRGGIVEDEVAVLDGRRGRLLGRSALGGRHVFFLSFFFGLRANWSVPSNFANGWKKRWKDGRRRPVMMEILVVGWMDGWNFWSCQGTFQRLGFRCGACRGRGSAALNDEISGISDGGKKQLLNSSD